MAGVINMLRGCRTPSHQAVRRDKDLLNAGAGAFQRGAVEQIGRNDLDIRSLKLCKLLRIATAQPQANSTFAQQRNSRTSKRA